MKAKKKVTQAALVLVSEPAMLGTLNRYIGIRLELARRTAAHAEAVARLNASFEEAGDVQQLRGEMAVLESSVALFATNHRSTLFPEGKKSKEYENATIGFRDDPPSVAKLISGDTFEAICLRLEELDWGTQYVEWKPALQKAALLRDRANLGEEQLKEAGIKFLQEEQFFITPKSEIADRAAVPVREVA